MQSFVSDFWYAPTYAYWHDTIHTHALASPITAMNGSFVKRGLVFGYMCGNKMLWNGSGLYDREGSPIPQVGQQLIPQKLRVKSGKSLANYGINRSIVTTLILCLASYIPESAWSGQIKPAIRDRKNNGDALEKRMHSTDGAKSVWKGLPEIFEILFEPASNCCHNSAMLVSLFNSRNTDRWIGRCATISKEAIMDFLHRVKQGLAYLLMLATWTRRTSSQLVRL